MAKKPIVETQFEHAEPSGPSVEDIEVATQKRIDAAVKVALAKAQEINTKDTGSKTSGLTKEDIMEVLAKVLPATIMAMEQAKSMSGHDLKMKELKAKLDLEEKCHVCRQSVGNGKGRGCGGPWKRDPKTGNYITEEVMDADGQPTGETRRIEDPNQYHVKMAVFPNDPIAEQQWDGIQLNGAYYRSQGPNHKVWVPKHNDFAAQILKFTEDQRILQTGRKKKLSSGTLSGTGQHQTNSPIFT